MEAVHDTHAVCEAVLCYTGDILDPKRNKYTLAYYVKMAKELERMGAHMLAIKDMAGLCRPYAAKLLVKALKDEVGLPIHFHTHDTSGLNAASVLKASDAGVDVADLGACQHERLDQPAESEFGGGRPAEHTARHGSRPRCAERSRPTIGRRCASCTRPSTPRPRTGSAEVYLHEMPGGQYTNLKEQAASMGLGHRWGEIARTYAEVNQLFGDIVKVTPSSKVVGDMTMFLITRGIKPADVVNLEPGVTPFPESVVDMLRGGLGQPLGGWPKQVQKVVLGKLKPPHRPGRACRRRISRPRSAHSPAACARSERTTISTATSCTRRYTPNYIRFRREYGNVSALPTGAFFYGLRPGEEISVDIEEGKTLFIRLISVAPQDKDGRRTVTYELNGMTRETHMADRRGGGRSPAAARRPILNDPLRSRRADSRRDQQHQRQRGYEGREGRQADGDGGDEDADHAVRPRSWCRAGTGGTGGRRGGEQGPSGPPEQLGDMPDFGGAQAACAPPKSGMSPSRP